MITFTVRRRWFIAVFSVLAVLCVLADAVYRLTLKRTTFVTGWMLLVLIVLLAGYNVRKKLTMLPLGSTWAPQGSCSQAPGGSSLVSVQTIFPSASKSTRVGPEPYST